MPALAIVIPAFKAEFLNTALASIAAQTRRDFRVYVADDHSPHDLASICRRWQGRIDLRYTRFEQNLGATDLVAQWSRSVALSREPWVWLFGDDDVMPARGVELLLQALEAEPGRHDIYRFNVERLDAQGRVTRQEPAYPELLGARAFLLARLRFEISSFAPEYLFSRRHFERTGGFVPFPRAWSSDDATWARLGQRAGIRTLPGAKVGWRQSGQNISSQHQLDGAEKALAQARFIAWMDRFLLDHPGRTGEPSDASLLAQTHDWFLRQTAYLGIDFFPRHWRALLHELQPVRQLNRVHLVAGMGAADLRRHRNRLYGRWLQSAA